HAAAHTPAASARYAASAPTPAASAVPALMSSTPFSPWIHTSEPILRYRPLAGGDGVSHPVTKYNGCETPSAASAGHSNSIRSSIMTVGYGGHGVLGEVGCVVGAAANHRR